MKILSCRVQNYRNILDSGWVDINNITAIVGKNESGKTSFLKALWKFNPFEGGQYNIDREWPSGKRKEKSQNKIVVEVRFAFDGQERNDLESISSELSGVTQVEVSRNYAGRYEYWLPTSLAGDVWGLRAIEDIILDELSGVAETRECTDYFKMHYQNSIQELIKIHRLKESLIGLSNLIGQVHTFVHPHSREGDGEVADIVTKQIKFVLDRISISPVLYLVDYVRGRLPTFVYMDDHRIFSGSAQLDEIKRRMNEERPSEGDRTIKIIMEMAGLNFENEVIRGTEEDREQRVLDMHDASHHLTKVISERWRQKKYEVMFQADGHHFITFVKDINGKALVPLEERSKGFQWFFSFDMRFMHETRGLFKNAVILLDEPGLHLHAAAQEDLLQRMQAYSVDNQLIYSTHLPFMIDFRHLDDIYVAEEMGLEGAKIHKNWATADKDARFTLQAALGLSWSQSLFVGPFNLIVEGVDDFWFLTTFSTLFEDAGQAGIDRRLVITPAGGASKVAYIGTILSGQKLNVAVLLDSDSAGEQASDQLVRQWILKDKNVVMIGNVIGKERCAIEDLFGEKYYLDKVRDVYEKEINGRPLNFMTSLGACIVEVVEAAFKEIGLGQYNKGRVAKRIMNELARSTISDVDKSVVVNFRKLIDAINLKVAAWK